MGLTKKIHVSLFDCQPYTIKGRTGEVYKGFIYEGFDRDGVVARFTSDTNDLGVHDLSGYSEQYAKDLILHGKTTLEGVIKWSLNDKSANRKPIEKDFSDQPPF